MHKESDPIRKSSEDNRNSIDTYQLKVENHTDESAIGFKYSAYLDSNILINTNLSKTSKTQKKQKNNSCCSCTKFRKQTNLMVNKNYLVFSRNIKPTLFQIFTPVAVSLILVLLQVLCDNYSESFINKNPKSYEISNLKKCQYPEDCVTIGYGIIGNNNTKKSEIEKVNNLMKEIADTNKLNFTSDVKLLTFGSSNDYLDYLSEKENKTKFGVLFCLDKIDVYNVSIPCSFEYQNETLHLYTILYNITNSPNGFLSGAAHPFPKDPELLKLKIDVDNAYLKFHAEKKGISVPKISANYSDFPTTENRLLEGADVVSSTGAFYFFFPPIISFVVILLEIMREKDLKLRKSLLIIGLGNSPFWLSWLITGLIFAALSSLVMVLIGLLFQFDVFLKSPYLITFTLFFLFNITMQFMAFFLCTILKSQQSAYTVSYGFILIGLVMEIFLSNYIIIYYLYATELPWWVGLIKLVFGLYPPFNFSKAYSDIAVKAASHFDNQELRWIKGIGYNWSDLFLRNKGKMGVSDVYYDVPSTAETMGMFLIDILLFSLLAFYFDHVDQSNQGKSFGYFFFLKKKFWCGATKEESNKIKEDFKLSKINKEFETNSNFSGNNINANTISEQKLLNEKNENEENGTFVNNSELKGVIEEKLKIIKSFNEEGNALSGLKILGCGKTYDINNGYCRTKKLHALKETFLNVPIGELFTILGHNGAGKSTMINILTGNLSPSFGSAEINNSDIIFDTTAAEQLIGLCPQHDILWEELTAEEHIIMYAKLRVEAKLKEVNLLLQKNLEVRTYSGGMKRRLSILLSTIGTPKVVFLDEPTTGLDPVNKRFIWSMIQKIKLDRSVILTTHSMEEADLLSDRIGVIVEGNFKCIGTPLELKEAYGVCENENMLRVKEMLIACMPSCKILDCSGGSIILNLPFDKMIEMKHFINILNNNYEDDSIKSLKGLVKECGMNYTTLEEIFLKLTANKLE